MYKFYCNFLLFLSIWNLLFAAQKTVDMMTLEEKVGQLFLVYFDGDCVNENAKRLIREAHIGGIIYYNWANGLDDPKRVLDLSNDLQQLAEHHIGIPLFIAVDQEGGVVARLQEGFTEFPGNAALSRTNQPELAYEVCCAMAKELQSVGINFNLAPVVDINSNPKNPVIGVRSFGSQRELVTVFGKESVRGFQKERIISCIKHFPGHGDVSVDSHIALPIVYKQYHELAELEFFPFCQLAGQVPAIMTAHVLFPHLDPVNCATLSSSIVKGILRDKLGFTGLIVTDSLTMQGVVHNHSGVEEVALKALFAGNDILLIGGRDLQNREAGESSVDAVIRIYKSILLAVREGKIDEARINDSVARIMKIKQDFGLSTHPVTAVKDISSQEHVQLAREIAYRSVEIRKWDIDIDFSQKKVTLIVPRIMEDKIRKTDLVRVGEQTSICIYENLQPSSLEQKKIVRDIQNCDYVIFCSYNSWKNSDQSELLYHISMKKPTACIAMRDPSDIDICDHLSIAIATYSPTIPSLQVAAEYLNATTQPLCVTSACAQKIGEKVWYNECRHRVDQLTFWNLHEPFPSIGIGHFIWPPCGYNGMFSAGRFYSVLEYMKKHHVVIPEWLTQSVYSPWDTREQFYNEFYSDKMCSLRGFLCDTVSYQARYMMERVNESFREIIVKTSAAERQKITQQFFDLARRPQGMYVLVDYLNFKHAGTDPKERYNDVGWGLQQVLLLMNDFPSEMIPEQRFAESAKKLLQHRVMHAPHAMQEEKWLPGWFNRLDTYYKPTL